MVSVGRPPCSFCRDGRRADPRGSHPAAAATAAATPTNAAADAASGAAAAVGSPRLAQNRRFPSFTRPGGSANPKP